MLRGVVCVLVALGFAVYSLLGAYDSLLRGEKVLPWILLAIAVLIFGSSLRVAWMTYGLRQDIKDLEELEAEELEAFKAIFDQEFDKQLKKINHVRSGKENS